MLKFASYLFLFRHGLHGKHRFSLFFFPWNPCNPCLKNHQVYFDTPQRQCHEDRIKHA